MTATAVEEKVPLEAKNKPFLVCGFLGAFWNLSYGPEDHLGSTRMVLNEAGAIQQALMYQPYGTVSDVDEMGAISTDPLRQKFTTKEYDEEGVNNEEADIYHHLNITVPNDQYTITGEITYGAGIPATVVNFQFFDETSGDDYYYCNGIIGNSTGNTNITSIVLHVTGPAGLDFDYTVDGLDYPIPAGNSRTVTLGHTIAEIQSAAGTDTNLYNIGELISLPEDQTIASYYFGARFYNPDLGLWLGTDPKEQFWNRYGYSTNPIMTIDPDGQYIVGAIIGGLIGAYGMGSLANGSFNPGKWDWDNASTWTGIIGGATAGASLGSSIENGIIASRVYSGTMRTAYGHAAGRNIINSGLYDSWLAIRGIEPITMELAAMGDLPPTPPGYDPLTWKTEMTDAGRALKDPKGTYWLEHAEDKGHWRHWDKTDFKDPKGGGRWPSNSSKPWNESQKKLKPNQSWTDPSGNASSHNWYNGITPFMMTPAPNTFWPFYFQLPSYNPFFFRIPIPAIL